MTDSDAPKSEADAIKRWRVDISASLKREDDYRKDGKHLWKMYEGELKESTPFNIFFSNTEILLPALYGALPRPVVQRRFKDADPLGKAASMAGERMLMFLRDMNSEEYDDFDTTMKENVLDACVPGRGLMEFCYDPKTAMVPTPDGKQSEQLVSECIYSETCLWNRYTFGYAKKWKDVPWVAFELYFDRDQAKEEFTPEVAAKLKYLTEGDQNSDSKDSPSREGDRKVTKVWKIWDKRSKRLLFVADSGYDDEYLKAEDDPYELEGFYPFPKPLRLIAKSGNLVPTAPYSEYENQAKELNTITVRLNRLIEMCKVRGVYDAGIDAIADALRGDTDGELQPTGEATTLSRDGGLDKHIWLLPIDKIVAVIQELYRAREGCKQTIYEIMGLADIMRGSTAASETLGAQKLKAQFGSVRMKNPQKEVQRYARDSFRIMLELAANKFMVETWAKATGLPYLTDEQAIQAQQAVQQQAQQAMMMAQQAQASGQPPPPPFQPPTLPPKWSDVLRVLRDDLTRQYKIDIETNSTIDPDASEAKQNMAELMNAISQFLNGIGPMVQDGVLSIDVAKAMLLGVVSKFEMGSEVEDLIRQMQPPKPQAQDKSGEQAAQAQLAAANLEKQGLQQELELEKKANALNAREGMLQVREAKVSASEELHRIQMTAAKSSMAGEHKTHMAQTKQVVDGGMAKVSQIAKEIDLKIKADAQSRATEKAAGEKVAASQSQSAGQLKSIEGLLKDLTVAIQAMTKATLTPKERKLVKGKDGKTAGMIESPVKE